MSNWFLFTKGRIITALIGVPLIVLCMYPAPDVKPPLWAYPLACGMFLLWLFATSTHCDGTLD